MSKFSKWLKNYLFEEENEEQQEEVSNDKIIQKVFEDISIEEKPVEEHKQQQLDLQEETKSSSFLNIEPKEKEEKEKEEKPAVKQPVSQPIKTVSTKEQYRPRPVISPIFGMQEHQTQQQFQETQTTKIYNKSIIGTVFSPINGVNTKVDEKIVKPTTIVKDNVVQTSNNQNISQQKPAQPIKEIVQQTVQVKQPNVQNNSPLPTYKTNEPTNNPTPATIQTVKVISPATFAQQTISPQVNKTIENSLHINANYQSNEQLKTEPIGNDDSVEQFSLF